MTGALHDAVFSFEVGHPKLLSPRCLASDTCLASCPQILRHSYANACLAPQIPCFESKAPVDRACKRVHDVGVDFELGVFRRGRQVLQVRPCDALEAWGGDQVRVVGLSRLKFGPRNRPPKKKRRKGLSDMPNSRKSKKAQIRPIRFAKRSDVPCSPVALSSFFFSHMLTSAAWAPPSPVPAKYTVLVVCAPSARTSGTQQTAKRRPRQPRHLSVAVCEALLKVLFNF